MTITALDLSRLRNAEFLQYASDFLRITSLNDASALSVYPQYNELEQAVREISALFVVDQGNETTPALQAADIRRDNALVGITAFCTGMAYHFEEARRTAANLISANVQLYGNSIARQNYMAETASITNIIADWNNKPELAQAIATLGLEGWKAELQAANNHFNDLYIARTQQLGAVSADTMAAKRMASMEKYYALRDRLDAYSVINQGANPWGKAIQELNALVEQYNTLLAERISNVKNTTDQEAAAAPEPETK